MINVDDFDKVEMMVGTIIGFLLIKEQKTDYKVTIDL